MRPTFAQRARKALVAGFFGGLSAVGTSFVFTGAPTKDQIGQMIGAFIVGSAVTGFATFRAKPNAADTKAISAANK